MVSRRTVGIVSDIHYAGPLERALGNDYEFRDLANPWLRVFLRLHRHYLWLRSPLEQNHLLDHFLAREKDFALAVANGDYSCDTRFVGVSDDGSCQSAQECLGRLRSVFGDRLRATFGDHELGKVSFVGHRGGMRLKSLERARNELGLSPFWQTRIGRYVLIGVTSSLVGLPVFLPDTLAEERERWETARREHLEEIRDAFQRIAASERILLFCHDPTALPFLYQEEIVRKNIGQIESTIIGHLHSGLILWKSRLLAGMPVIHFLGTSARRLSSALREARRWKPFRVRLCPSLAGIELLKDGGFMSVELDEDAREPALFKMTRIPRSPL